VAPPYERPSLPILPETWEIVRQFLSPSTYTTVAEGGAALLSDIATGRMTPMAFGTELTQRGGGLQNGYDPLADIDALLAWTRERQAQMPVTTRDVADASRKYVAEPYGGAFLQQIPGYDVAQQAFGLAPRTMPMHPLSWVLGPAVGTPLAFLSSPNVGREYQEAQQFTRSQPPLVHGATNFLFDPLGLPANIAVGMMAPQTKLAQVGLGAYNAANSADLLANVASSDIGELAAMGLAGAGLKGAMAMPDALKWFGDVFQPQAQRFLADETGAIRLPGGRGARVREVIEREGLDELDDYAPGDVWERVVWGGVPRRIETNPLSALGRDDYEGVYGVHVTSDPDYWIARLEEDYDRSPDDARVLRVRLAPGDALVDDWQYITDPETGIRASSAVLLTPRRYLRAGQDFVEGQGQFADELAARQQAVDLWEATARILQAELPTRVQSFLAGPRSFDDALAVERAFTDAGQALVQNDDWSVLGQAATRGASDTEWQEMYRNIIIKRLYDYVAGRMQP
jgi:hypothetical protein